MPQQSHSYSYLRLENFTWQLRCVTGEVLSVALKSGGCDGRQCCLCCASALLLVLIAVQALVDVAAQGGCLASALAVMELVQSLVQVRNSDENAMLFLSL